MLKQVVFYVDQDVKLKAQKYLSKDGTTLSAYIRKKLIYLVREKEKEENNGNI